MRKIVSAAVLGLALVMAGCAAGPHQLQRTVDDFDGQLYTESPWLDGVLWVVPVFPIAHFVAAIGDFFIVDAYHFWFKDAWDGQGSGFKHKEILGADGYLESLLLEGASFLTVQGGGMEEGDGM